MEDLAHEASKPEKSRPGSRQIYLYAVLACALLVKADLVAVTADTPLVWDERDYFTIAKTLAAANLDPRAFPGAYRSPGYPYFLALPLFVFGPKILYAKLWQVIFSVFSAWLLYLFVRRRHGELAGIVAAALLSFLPELCGMSLLLYSETIFIGLFIPALDLLARWHESRSKAAALASGALFGIATLVKTGFIPCILVMALVMVLVKGRRRFLGAALFLLAFALVLSPWLLRNAALFGKPRLTSNVWVNLLSGNRDKPFMKHYFSIPDEAKREAWAKKEALSWIRKQGVWWLPVKLHRNIPLLFGSANFSIRHFWLGSYRRVRPLVARVIIVLSVACYLSVMALGIAGIVAAPWDALKLHSIGILTTIIGVHVVMVALSRYREPLMPVFIIYAAYAVSQGKANVVSTWRRPAALGLLAILLYAQIFAISNRFIVELWHGKTFVYKATEDFPQNSL